MHGTDRKAMARGSSGGKEFFCKSNHASTGELLQRQPPLQGKGANTPVFILIVALANFEVGLSLEAEAVCILLLANVAYRRSFHYCLLSVFTK